MCEFVYEFKNIEWNGNESKPEEYGKGYSEAIQDKEKKLVASMK
jgi:hypothetical protein